MRLVVGVGVGEAPEEGSRRTIGDVAEARPGLAPEGQRRHHLAGPVLQHLLASTDEAMHHCLPYYTDLYEQMKGAGKQTVTASS